MLRGSGATQVNLIDCEIAYCTGTAGVNFTSLGAGVITGCWIHDNAKGIVLSAFSTSISHNIIEDNSGDGIDVNLITASAFLEIHNNTIDGNGGDGIADLGSWRVAIFNNVMSNNTGYGISGDSGVMPCLCDYNDFYNNTAGAQLNVPAGANDLALDPQYTDAANNDFSIGTNLKAKGFPIGGSRKVGANQSGTYSYVDMGASQRAEAAGGSGGLKADQGWTGGMNG